MTAPRVAFLGTPAVAVPVLERLASVAAPVVVYTNPDKPTGRGRVLEASPVKTSALSLGLPLLQPESWRAPETRAQWEHLAIDLAVVVAYGHILPAWMLDACNLGAWNLHFSLLPRWRGASPVHHAVLHGDEHTGVSLMRITPGLDAGPVQDICSRAILDTDTAEGLLAQLAEDAAALLERNLAKLLAGQGSPKAQDEERVTLAPKLTKAMAALDPTRPALELHRQVRALQPWPGVECTLENVVVKVYGVGALRPSVAAPGHLAWDRGGAWLTAGDGLALQLTHLQRPGKPVQPALQALQPWGGSGELYLR